MKDYFLTYAEHGKWANNLIFESLKHISDEDYYRLLIPGVRSLHHLLNHMTIIDELWIAEIRQSGERKDISSSDQYLYPDRAAMAHARHKMDDELIDCISKLDAGIFDLSVQYDGFGMEWPIWIEFAHVFRHQVHHRGQITAMIGHLGLELPKVDPMFFPKNLSRERKAVYDVVGEH